MNTMNRMTFLTCTLGALLLGSLSNCKQNGRTIIEPEPEPNPPVTTPYTNIPQEYVGIWYADHNEGPLTANWEKGTFQGEQGFREFRTMVFTADGKNAVEYTSEVFNSKDEVLQIIYKITGTLTYSAKDPQAITFYAQTGIRRTFSSNYSGYRDAVIKDSDMQQYRIVWEKPQATNMTSAKNYLTATITDQDGRYATKYAKVGSGNPAPTTGLPSTTPPATGTYVKIGNLYYPTVMIGNQEWITTNYAGPGSLNEANKPQYGTFLELADLAKLSLPAGWRVPSRQDYNRLLDSQGITYTEWGTDGDHVPSKRLLGQLMNPDAWTKKDGYANNKSGFNAMPGDVRRPRGTNYGEGTNCTLWTADRDAEDNPVVFNIIQLGTSTYASFAPQPIGSFPILTPLRLVRDR